MSGEGVLPAATSKPKKSKADKPGLYIVFNPEGETPPKVTHGTFKEAATAAWQMSRFKPGQTFHVMKAVGRPFAVKAEAEVAT